MASRSQKAQVSRVVLKNNSVNKQLAHTPDHSSFSEIESFRNSWKCFMTPASAVEETLFNVVFRPQSMEAHDLIIQLEYYYQKNTFLG